MVKFNFYRSKDRILQTTRGKATMEFQEHPYQLFVRGPSPYYTSEKKGAQPYVLTLQNHLIAYCWGFLYRLSFMYVGQQHIITLVAEAEDCFQAPAMQTSQPRQNTTLSPRLSLLGAMKPHVFLILSTCTDVGPGLARTVKPCLIGSTTNSSELATCGLKCNFIFHSPPRR